MTAMRAKVQVGSVFQHKTADQQVTGETVRFFGVCRKNGYADTDGYDEDNTFARYSPSVDFSIMIANPALFGQFAPGQTFYADFTPADA